MVFLPPPRETLQASSCPLHAFSGTASLHCLRNGSASVWWRGGHYEAQKRSPGQEKGRGWPLSFDLLKRPIPNQRAEYSLAGSSWALIGIPQSTPKFLVWFLFCCGPKNAFFFFPSPSSREFRKVWIRALVTFIVLFACSLGDTLLSCTLLNVFLLISRLSALVVQSGQWALRGRFWVFLLFTNTADRACQLSLLYFPLALNYIHIFSYFKNS